MEKYQTKSSQLIPVKHQNGHSNNATYLQDNRRGVMQPKWIEQSAELLRWDIPIEGVLWYFDRMSNKMYYEVVTDEGMKYRGNSGKSKERDRTEWVDMYGSDPLKHEEVLIVPKSQGLDTDVSGVKENVVVDAYYKGYGLYGIVVGVFEANYAIKVYKASEEGKFTKNPFNVVFVNKESVKKVEHPFVIQEIKRLSTEGAQAEKLESESLTETSKNKDNWKSDHVNREISQQASRVSGDLLKVVHHKVPRQLMIDFYSRLSDAQKFKLQLTLDVSGRKEYLSMGSNLQLGPEKRSDETPDIKYQTVSEPKYVATFDPNKRKNDELDKISTIYKQVYDMMLHVFRSESPTISDGLFNHLLQLILSAEKIHYENNQGRLLESPEGRWEEEDGVYRKKGKDVSERESDRPLRDLKRRDLRADFDRQQRLKKGAGQSSIAYYDVNSGMEERAHFGYDPDDPTQLGYSYKFDH